MSDNLPETSAELHRRDVLRGAATAAVALPLLAACGGSGGSGSSAGSTPTAKAGQVLAKTADVKVGGAVFLDQPNVVITQPTQGDFHGFVRTCTHQQCPVTDIQSGKIHCSCHGSLYDMTTGKNVSGPAPSPLTKFPIKVQGADIVAG